MSLGTGRQLLVLLALVTVAVVLWLRPAADGPAGMAGTTSNEAGAGLPETVVAVDDVRLDQLTGRAPAVPAPGRDPFRFRQVVAESPAAVPPPPPPVRFDDPPQSVASPAAQVPPIPLRYMGWLESPRPGEGLVGIFTATPAGQGMPFFGKAGDVIEGRYRVLRVTQDSAELAHLDGRGRQTIRISGQ
jgi:hypothetical protein